MATPARPRAAPGATWAPAAFLAGAVEVGVADVLAGVVAAAFDTEVVEAAWTAMTEAAAMKMVEKRILAVLVCLFVCFLLSKETKCFIVLWGTCECVLVRVLSESEWLLDAGERKEN